MRYKHGDASHGFVMGEERVSIWADGHRSIFPLPDQKELAELYRDHYFQNYLSDTHSPNYTTDELAHKRLQSGLIFQALERHVQGDALEVGFGEGFTLAVGAERGWEMTGIDYTDEALKRWNPDSGANILIGEPEELMINASYSAVILQNVLEHVADPNALLERTAALLAPDGLVALAVPNDYSTLQLELVNRGLVDHEYWFQPPQHLHYFNTENIVDYLETLGWEVVDGYSDFPVEFFLLHSGSNYVADRSRGKEVHHARVTLELLMAEGGLETYLNHCRSLHRCGMGRVQTLLLRPKMLP